MKNYILTYKEFLTRSFDESNEVNRLLKTGNIIHVLINNNPKDLQLYNGILKNRYKSLKK